MFCIPSSGIVSTVQHRRHAYIVRSIRGSVLELVPQICLGRMEHIAVESMDHKARDKLAERIVERQTCWELSKLIPLKRRWVSNERRGKEQCPPSFQQASFQ